MTVGNSNNIDGMYDDIYCEYSNGGGEGTWLTSYSDMVTLLLCFFIIFFNINATQSSDWDTIIANINSNFPTELSAEQKLLKKNASGSAAKGVNQVGAETGVAETAMSDISKELMNHSFTAVVREKKTIIVDFKSGDFFYSGSSKISPLGQKNLIAVAETLKNQREKLIVTVRGHTDTTPVARKKHRNFSDNMELSTLRALAAYRLLIGEGFSESQLVVSGYGEYAKVDSESDEQVIEQNHQRRISLKIELKR